MTESTGPATQWTHAVSRSELATKALASTIKLWDSSGPAPTLEKLSWLAVEGARACLVQAQIDEKRAFKRLEDAQSQTAIDFASVTAGGVDITVEDAVGRAPEMAEGA